MQRQRTGGMTTFHALRGNAQQDPFGSHVQGVAHHREAGNVLFGICAGRRIEEIDPVIRAETAVECDSQEAVLNLLLNVEVACDGDAGSCWVVDFDIAAALDVKHAAIGRNGQLQWVGGTAIQDDFLEVRVNGRARVSRFYARGELDSVPRRNRRLR